MEFCNNSISYKLPISPAITCLTWKNTPSIIVPCYGKPHHCSSFPVYLLRPILTRRFHISARIGRQSSRQNYLRKKLTQRKDGESKVWDKLENWAERSKKDSGFWGIGTGPIFTIFQDSQGKIERVVVNEEEIRRRSRLDWRFCNEPENLEEVNSKIYFAEGIAREMEKGINVLPKNSVVAKFVVSDGKSSVVEGESRLIEGESPLIEGESHHMRATRGFILFPGWFRKMSGVGILVLCSFFVFQAVRGMLTTGKDSKELTKFEKEMLKRKMKSRMEKEEMLRGSVEMMQEPLEPKGVPFKRPSLDKEELANSIIKAKGSNNELTIPKLSSSEGKDLTDKIEEIRVMARHAREVERRSALQDDSHGQDLEFSSEVETPENNYVVLNDLFTDKKESAEEPSLLKSDDLVQELESSDSSKENLHSDGAGGQSGSLGKSSRKRLRIINSAEEAREYLSRKHQSPELNKKYEIRSGEEINAAINMTAADVASANTNQVSELTDEVCESISLGQKHETLLRSDDHDLDSEAEGRTVDRLKDVETSRILSDTEVSTSNRYAELSMPVPQQNEADVASADTDQVLELIDEVCSISLGQKHENLLPSEVRDLDSKAEGRNVARLNDVKTFRIPSGTEVSTSNRYAEISKPVPQQNEADVRTNNNQYFGTEVLSPQDMIESASAEVSGGVSVEIEGDTHQNEMFTNFQVPDVATSGESNGGAVELTATAYKGDWIEKNIGEFEPILKKIGVGFRENYKVAREKASLDAEMLQLQHDGREDELEWMKDEKLRDIVFKVRENELSGRDPFHLMKEEDKCTFLSGLDKRVEAENKKLLNLHEYLHSNIENLDYGADGISLYDPPHKIIPRWKVPPAESLNVESLENSSITKNTGDNILRKASNVSKPNPELKKDPVLSSKTIIQGSDGSVKAGKKSGREFWQHTKKWSQGFMDSYNAETDPEVKAVMKDIGKDLDRWITEKEIKEAAELMDKLPEKGRDFIKQKLDKVKREMELFGPQAVVSKYREYAEEKEEDYLWWLDLPYVLCIELYTVEDGEQRVGLYSLEMAADLELDPKQYHVIAFEDAGDCKNLCYIIQGQMEMLGNGQAFVVARPPKDAFTEAKANGFSVTVVRKGELGQLNVDQILEEVEESLVEIGSKIYQDKITKERSVDINGLMKGVFGVKKLAKRKRLKRKVKRSIKP